MKIVSSGRTLNSQEFYRKKRRRRNLKIIFSVVAVLVILFGFVYVSRLDKFLISEIVIEAESVVDQSEIVAKVEESIAGYYLWLIPRANDLLFSRSDIEASLLESFPRLKSVDVSLKGLKTLGVEVEEREPFALYCLSEGDCYFIDREAVIFAKAPTFSEPTYFIYTTQSSLEDVLGKKLLETEEFETLLYFIDNLSTLDIYSSALEIGERELTLTFLQDSKLTWQRSDDLALVYRDLEAFLSSEVIRSQGDFLERVSVLDLRTENKVFYKFKDE